MLPEKKKHLWIVDDIIQSSSPVPPAELSWVCEVCGPQPPVSLTGNRWVKRQCACQREVHKAQIQAVQPEGVKTTPMTSVAQLLRPNGPPPPDLFWTCVMCGLIPPLAIPGGRWVRRKCACERQVLKQREQEKIRAEWSHEQSIRTFGGWLGAKWIDRDVVRELCRKTFDVYDPTRQPEAYEKAYAFAERPKGNLLLYGSYGTGKTHLEAAICNALREVGRLLSDGSRESMTSLFVSAPQFFMAFDETRRSFDQTNHIRLVEHVMGAPVLVIDDIDKSRPKEERWEIYWMIFNARCTARRPTILSTNKKEELDLYIGEASLSRFSQGLVSAKMVGADYRQEEEV
jgi:DNA replication protein DnaC